MKTKVKYQTFVDFPDMDTVKDIILYGANKRKGQKQYVFINMDNEVETKNFTQVYDDFRGLGQHLYDIGLRGKKVALLSENSYYWIASYYAIATGKMTGIPLDPKLPDDELVDLMVRSGCDAIIYSKDFNKTIELMKADPEVKITEYLRIEDFYSLSQQGLKSLDGGVTCYLEDTVQPDDLAFIVYTSGTTGKSKGVMLSQRNVASDVCCCCRVNTGRQAIGFLPLHHTFSWVSAIFSVYLVDEAWGYMCRSIKDLQKDIMTYKPQNFSAVPLAVETIYKRIWFTAKKDGKEELLKKGLKISGFLMKLGIDRRRKIFKDIIDNLGGELEMIICGGAYLDETYEKGMYDFGIQIVNGYGITECSPVVTCNTVKEFKFGSAGKPIACNQIKIHDPDEDGVGEIYIKGTNVMLGYYNDPQATAEAFDDGWFKSGDYGYIDEDGFLFFRGRKKNLIVLSNGKNVSPEEIENHLMMLDYVKEVVVYDENGFITAEFYLDTVSTPDAKDRIKGDVNTINKQMPMYKQVAKVKVRDTEFPKTTTLKIKRNYK
ncbi:MAG: AMP-binding protein [Clostridia bacterium]|nr:AMP-binding protein [Clostridia bacterium]